MTLTHHAKKHTRVATYFSLKPFVEGRVSDELGSTLDPGIRPMVLSWDEKSYGSSFYANRK
jgi:hypothetical protein